MEEVEEPCFRGWGCGCGCEGGGGNAERGAGRGDACRKWDEEVVEVNSEEEGEADEREEADE